MTKILFLDIDGVVNCATTAQRHRGFIGIDPFMALLVDRIIQATGCKVVVSSSWRHTQDGLDEIKAQVCAYIDVTPDFRLSTSRGTEIKEWLKTHPAVEKYAILDDNSDMLDEQLPHFFKTSWEVGLTEEIANAVIKHLI